uniref:Death domain-containing protein n=2 Tax=Amphimedon queenslandica TaxID=400682 RepID=A0A1X7TDM8_AMPQE
MIDVSQWRASIGLWNYCQAASSRPANGRHSYSFKAAVDSKSGSTTSGEKTSKLPAALSLIVSLLLSLLRYMKLNFIPPTGIITVTVMIHCLQSLVLFIATIGSSSDLIYYLVLLLLLLLSGDVELNPGPMIDDQPDISLLIKWLEPLVEWKLFGLYLVGMEEHEILKIEQEHIKIEDRKLALYSKWLSVNPKATWRNVIDALTSRSQNKLAQDIKNAIERDALCTISPKTPNSDGDVEIILFPNEDQAVQDSLDELQAKFSHIMTEIKSAFRKKVANNDKVTTIELSTKISDWVENQLHWAHGTVGSDLDDIFKKIYHYYDFIDCSLIVAMCNEFISDEKDLLDELKTYSLNANAFHSSEPITELKQKLRKVYGPYRQHLEDMPLICIELQNPWNDVKINGLYILIERLLPKRLRQSIMKCITIEEGSVVIKLHILDITADSLIEYTGEKLQFMHLIGIFSLYINDHPVLQEDQNMNFTFELALLEAVTAGNNEAVKFLLQLETVNIDHTNEEGKTALMLACERGHEDIVHSLKDTLLSHSVKLFHADDRPDMDSFITHLEPLDDWEPFAFCLPGIIQQDIDEIKTEGSSYLRMKALHEKWLEVYPHASWREVITALRECEKDLYKTIKLYVIDPNSIRAVHMITNPGPIITGNPKDILRTHSSQIVESISIDRIRNITRSLYAKGLIPNDTKQEMLKDDVKATSLTNAIEQKLKFSPNPGQYFIDVCHELEKEPTLKDITKSMISELVKDDSNDRVGYISCVIAREDLKPGDHIHVYTSAIYTHHGIYIGEPNCDMIHFSGESKLKEIRKATIDEFCEGKTLRLYLVSYNCSKATKFSSFFRSTSCHIEKAMPPSETVKLALHFLNYPKEWGEYHIKNNNSEVFACFCKTGRMDIAAQLHPLRWIPIFENLTCETYKEALENYRKMKRQSLYQ